MRNKTSQVTFLNTTQNDARLSPMVLRMAGEIPYSTSAYKLLENFPGPAPAFERVVSFPNEFKGKFSLP